MSYFSELFVASASVAALLFAILGIAGALQDFSTDVLEHCKAGFWLIFIVCFASLYSFLTEEVMKLGVSLGFPIIEHGPYYLLAFQLILTGMFSVGLFELGRAIKKLLGDLFRRSIKGAALNETP